MSDGRNWERVEECYFGSANHTSFVTYRVADDGGVQRLEEFGADTTQESLGRSGSTKYILPVLTENVSRLNDVQAQMIVDRAGNVTAWYRGWSDDLTGDSLVAYVADKRDSFDGAPRIYGWLEFVGEGSVRPV